MDDAMMELEHAARGWTRLREAEEALRRGWSWGQYQWAITHPDEMHERSNMPLEGDAMIDLGSDPTPATFAQTLHAWHDAGLVKLKRGRFGSWYLHTTKRGDAMLEVGTPSE